MTRRPDASAAFETLDDKTAALVVQSPNFFGCIEDLKSLADAAHAVGALFVVVVTEAISFGLLKTPGECGADIVVGEGQSWGVPMGFGGPHVGLFATQEKFVRQMPGRLCGVAYDKNGNRGFVLTLSTREQHIRREKATSNICTNQGLIALAATIYMETMGKKGLQEVAMQNAQKAAYAKDQIAAIDGYSRSHFLHRLLTNSSSARPSLRRGSSKSTNRKRHRRRTRIIEILRRQAE